MTSEPSIDLLRAALPEPDIDRARALSKPFRQAAVLDALRVARTDARFATPALSRFFRRKKSLGARDRRAVQGAVFDIIRHESILFVSGAHNDAKMLDKWMAVLEGDRLDKVKSATPAEDLAIALSLGYRVAREWLDVLGPSSAAELARVQATRAPTMVRANRLKCTRDRLQDRLMTEGIPSTPHPHAVDALVLTKRTAFHTLESFQEGWFEVQDASSQRFVDAIPLEPGQTVLDLCAGAGGKSLALAARGAKVRAWDIRDSALNELEKRAHRAGALVRIAPPQDADIVVVDAPCSGTGRLRREPALRWKIEQDALLPLQAELVATGAALVKPKGLLAYATCSLLKAENQPPLPDSLADSFELIDENLLWPHLDEGDGFGWRIWRRT